MKKVFIVAILALSLNSFAQDRKEKHSRGEMEQMTPEQRSQLLVKKMTLELDLNAKQQDQVAKIIAEQSAKREAMRAERKAKMEEGKINRFEMANKLLDEQIAMKEKEEGVDEKSSSPDVDAVRKEAMETQQTQQQQPQQQNIFPPFGR